jgi:hypothetical protein
MSRLKFLLVAALVTFSLGVMISVVLSRRTEVSRPSNQEVRLIIPKASWEPIFFQSINLVTKLTAQAELRTASLGEDEHEARVWWGFGLSPLEGISLRYGAGQWRAIHVKADDYYEPTKATREELKPPKSGWNTTWQRLVDAGIMSLVDASEVNCGEGGLDGISVVVETSIGHTYRTYMYPNPMLEKCSQAKQIMKIAEIIGEEFEWTHTDTTPPPNKRLERTRR